MHHPFTLRVAAALLVVALAACQPDSSTETTPPESPAAATDTAATDPTGAASEEIAHELIPLPGKEGEAPVLTRAVTIVMETTAGPVTIEVYPEAAPNAAERFEELVEAGFYDGTPVSRVVAGFVAQFGINWREPHNAWQQRPFNDDPTIFALERGTLAFAKAGPNSNTTQVFINTVENNRLADPQYNFTVFGRVVDGMDVVDSFVQVGDPSGGLDQARLWSNGDEYLASLPVQPTMIERAYVQ